MGVILTSKVITTSDRKSRLRTKQLGNVTDREAPASGLAASVPTGHAAHSHDSDQDHRT
jgi:hypothetical protein